MAEHTAIGWCDGTCNFWIGCTKVSVGELGACEHCYAEDWAKRYYPSAQWGDFPRKRTAEATWKAPYAWDRKAAREGTPASIDWVICGGESGPHRREMNPDWARSLRDQCQRAEVPFFFKQWPGLRPKSNGCELDGREWKERPHVAPLPALAKQGELI